MTDQTASSCRGEPKAKESVVDVHHNDSPEALVRSDTIWINYLRMVLIAILVMVAVSMTVGTYKILSHLEYNKYRSEFERISSQISFNFLNDIGFKVGTARLAVRALSKDGNFRDLNTQFLDDITTGAQAITLWTRILWLPLLWTRSERQQWEAYASKNWRQDNNSYVDAAACFVCGEGMEVGTPATAVTIPGKGSFTCNEFEQAGLGGYIPTEWCAFVSNHVQANCNCRPATANASAAIDNNVTIANHIFYVKDGKRITDNGPVPWCPVWEGSPPVPVEALLFNQMTDHASRQALTSMFKTKLPTFSPTRYPDNEYQALLKTTLGFPKCSIYYPVFDNSPNSTIIGSISLDFQWQLAMSYAGNLPLSSNGIVLVLENNQDQQQYTFQVTGNTISFVGAGDHHDTSYDASMKQSTYEALQHIINRAAPDADPSEAFPKTALLYNLRIYSSDSFKQEFVTRLPVTATCVVACIFVFTSILFVIYDILVRRRQTKVMQSALQTNEIVASVFPDFIKSRLMANTKTIATANGSLTTKRNGFYSAAPKHLIRNMLGTSETDMSNMAFDVSEPIADFYPNVTVIFADIAGFTAWSSEREPAQVFQLLESVYQIFDKIAEKHGVFKVETIGDCYVAVTGLPEAQPDHAVRMTLFAHEIMLHMHEAAVSLESLLGPGTASLSIRVGLHSGSVTGGVLRGDKARFQLFGDTMNTAARMQSTGMVNRIQISKATATHLIDAGCNHWLDKRDVEVNVKGKGDMQTYWVDPASPEGSEPPPVITSDLLSTRSTLLETPNEFPIFKQQRTSEDGLDRLVDWNVDLLVRYLKMVVAGRMATNGRSQRRPLSTQDALIVSSISNRPIDDVTEVIEMTEFCEKKADVQVQPESIELGDTVRAQLREYVKRIADMYRDNPFHNFEHASHVVMSATKIIKRIVRPEDVDYSQEKLKKKDRKKAVAHQIHQSTFGIGSDALMQFAVIFSAIIHDVDHTGVSNAQLVKEKDQVALQYDNKCVAEQNSVQIAWDLLMEEQFGDLRACIYTCNEEKHRFRQLIVNAVIATDIADRDLQMLRKNRWNKAFYDHSIKKDIAGDDMSCKATVVFEYIIQASDVAHTMQHWHVYNRWNERLFEERYKAWLAGREEKDPSLTWYNGEIWFFDNYIIPLARKLETCGVFGVSSDEYLNYALENRHEWELKGREVVQNLVEKYVPKLDSVV